MVVVGLTGGIGSGKSTVARMLEDRGAVVVDADVAARVVVEPGRPALDAIVERFGRDVLGPDGRLDRTALAAVAFGSDEARRDLNAIVHPAVHREMLAGVAAAADADPDAVVVLDVPLLAEVGRAAYPVDGVIVVDLPVDIAVARLVDRRGLDEADARARVAAQATREERRAIADVVIDNAGDLHHLEAEVARAWAWIEGLARPPRA
jgi:dephospho-CoA kinase